MMVRCMFARGDERNCKEASGDRDQIEKLLKP